MQYNGNECVSVCIARMKIMGNIAISFVKLGQFNDAVTSFEHIMTEEPSFRTGLNLILCYFALRDRDNMKRTFERLLAVDVKIDDDHKYTTNSQVCLSVCLPVCLSVSTQRQYHTAIDRILVLSRLSVCLSVLTQDMSQ